MPHGQAAGRATQVRVLRGQAPDEVGAALQSWRPNLLYLCGGQGAGGALLPLRLQPAAAAAAAAASNGAAPAAGPPAPAAEAGAERSEGAGGRGGGERGPSGRRRGRQSRSHGHRRWAQAPASCLCGAAQRRLLLPRSNRVPLRGPAGAISQSARHAASLQAGCAACVRWYSEIPPGRVVSRLHEAGCMNSWRDLHIRTL